jgi:hypothetical protein
MKREQYEDAKKVLSEIAIELKSRALSAEQRQMLETHSTQLAGMLTSIWLPFSWWRRLVMLVLLLLGMLWPFGESHMWAIAWLLMLTFSPRIMGLTAYAFGRFGAGLGNDKE